MKVFTFESLIEYNIFSCFIIYRHRLSGMDMKLSDYDGRTALHLAAAEGHLQCVKFLLEQCQVPCKPKDR
jgi:hypothetical protein